MHEIKVYFARVGPKDHALEMFLDISKEKKKRKRKERSDVLDILDESIAEDVTSSCKFQIGLVVPWTFTVLVLCSKSLSSMVEYVTW